jgi:hypothetical protein
MKNGRSGDGGYYRNWTNHYGTDGLQSLGTQIDSEDTEKRNDGEKKGFQLLFFDAAPGAFSCALAPLRM